MLNATHYKNQIIYLSALTALALSAPLKASDRSFSASSSHEIRLGLLRHDIGHRLKSRYEKGVDINGEILFACPNIDALKMIWQPRPHLGASLNAHHASNQYYGGLTWHFDMTQLFFIEASFGGEVHSGQLKKSSKYKRALGSRALFRESVSAGVNLAQRHTASIMLDHASTAGLAKPNPGLTALGIRYGYKF